MKTFKFSTLLVILATLALPARSANDVAASDSPPATSALAAPDTSVQKPSEPMPLSYGVEDILKMTRAKVSDDVTVSFIKNSGRLYQMTASEIIYLHNEGMSDQVINTMLNQSQRLTPTAPPAAAPTGSPQYATASAPASSVYVIPSSTYYDYSYDPYYSYYPYYGYGYPWLSLGFGCWGGGYYRGGYYCGNRYYGSGYRGGGHYGGGWTGGGHPSGGSIGGGHFGGGHSGGGWTGGGHSAGSSHASFASGGGSRGGGGGMGRR